MRIKNFKVFEFKGFFVCFKFGLGTISKFSNIQERPETRVNAGFFMLCNSPIFSFRCSVSGKQLCESFAYFLASLLSTNFLCAIFTVKKSQTAGYLVTVGSVLVIYTVYSLKEYLGWILTSIDKGTYYEILLIYFSSPHFSN